MFYDQIPENISGMHSGPAIFTTIGGGLQLQFAGGGCDWEQVKFGEGVPLTILITTLSFLLTPLKFDSNFRI